MKSKKPTLTTWNIRDLEKALSDQTAIIPSLRKACYDVGLNYTNARAYLWYHGYSYTGGKIVKK